jgi:hypothetical protein
LVGVVLGGGEGCEGEGGACQEGGGEHGWKFGVSGDSNDSGGMHDLFMCISV